MNKDVAYVFMFAVIFTIVILIRVLYPELMPNFGFTSVDLLWVLLILTMF